MADHCETKPYAELKPPEADGRDGTPPRCRVALYSHDTVGLGHMRRNALVARCIAESRLPASILLIAGAREVCSFPLPPDVDCLALPALQKEKNGEYQSRSLNVSLNELIGLRSQAIAGALESFDPDVFIVDKVPRGALRELEPALEVLRRRSHTRCVLGLRDVLDDAATVRRELCAANFDDAVRDYYDAIWIYGDPAVYDQVREYEYPADIALKVHYSGYLARPGRTEVADIEGGQSLLDLWKSGERLVVCMVGGGQDGAVLAEAFAQVDFSPGRKGVIITGPFMPPEVQRRLEQLALGRHDLRVLRFVTDPDLLLSLADRVVGMGGYNTVCEVLSFEKPALIVPRVTPRQEQLIRAERFQNLGLLEMLHPDDLSPARLARWLDTPRDPPRGVAERIKLDGSKRIPQMLEALLVGGLSTAPSHSNKKRIPYAVC